ncbi:MAG: sterol desaturase family protein, partial [Bacteroidota bacterium]
MRTFITYAFYPILLGIHIIVAYLAITQNWDLGTTFSWIAGPRLLSLAILEFTFPMKKEWKMSWASFFRDLKYVGAGILVFQGLDFLLSIFMIWLAKENTGLLQDSSIWGGFILTALVFEFFQYWYHRMNHELKGPIGNFFWKTHAAHHLPEQVYLLMHVIFHPINAFFTFFIIQGTLILMGARAESIFLLNLFMGLQGLVSHFNVEIKAGPINYIFIGTELHRSHHSADPVEAKNYGAFLSIWDIVFGT